MLVTFATPELTERLYLAEADEDEIALRRRSFILKNRLPETTTVAVNVASSNQTYDWRRP